MLYENKQHNIWGRGNLWSPFSTRSSRQER